MELLSRTVVTCFLLQHTRAGVEEDGKPAQSTEQYHNITIHELGQIFVRQSVLELAPIVMVLRKYFIYFLINTRECLFSSNETCVFSLPKRANLCLKQLDSNPPYLIEMF